MKKMTTKGILVLIVLVLLFVISCTQNVVKNQNLTNELNKIEIKNTTNTSVNNEVKVELNEVKILDSTKTDSVKSEIAVRPSYNEIVFESDLTFTDFPWVKEVNFDSGAKYSAEFITDKEIRFVVYSEKRYNEWKSGGIHTISKATTKSGPICCSTSKSFSFDINSGEGGKYYVVIDVSDISFKEDYPTKGKIKITKLSGI